MVPMRASGDEFGEVAWVGLHIYRQTKKFGLYLVANEDIFIRVEDVSRHKQYLVKMDFV